MSSEEFLTASKIDGNASRSVAVLGHSNVPIAAGRVFRRKRAVATKLDSTIVLYWLNKRALAFSISSLGNLRSGRMNFFWRIFRSGGFLLVD